MVNSILNSKINYPEIKILDPEDKNFDASMYQISLLGKDIIIAIGQAKYTFIDDDIIYYPIYLIKDDTFYIQIGIYEILASQLPNIIDDDGDIELEKIDEPLLYQFINADILSSKDNDSNKKRNSDDKTSDHNNDDDDDDDDDDDNKAQDEDEEDNVILPEQNEEIVEKELNEYKKEKGQPWVQSFFKSNEYQLTDNEGGGDCLFAVIRDAFKAIDKDINIIEMRRKLADEVTPEIYEHYKEKYDMFANNIHDTDTEMKKLNKTNNELRDKLKNSKDRNDQQQIVEYAKQVADKYKSLKSEMKISKELMGEFNFMKKVHNIEDFKKLIKTCDFWADTWAISTLERVLNIKLIIFSSEEWKEGDSNNVLQCGQLNDIILEEKGIFEPQYYILLDYTGNHYKLISYKHHRIFTFKEIPYSIKLDISKNCLQGSSGPYKIIPQFTVFNNELGIEEPIELDVDVITENENNLYDNSIVFQYYNKSNTKPLPGKGNGETIPVDKIKDFSKLAEINDWRRKLDNKYVAPFELDGHKWKTVEHYYQGNKFKDTNKEYYLLFSLDSDSKISEDVELAIAAGSKMGKHKGKYLRSKEIKIDPDFYGGNHERVLENGLYAKFSQDHTDLKQALIQTHKAKLLHYKKGMEPEVSNILMLVRSKLSN
tara:strand:- start:55 stop:2019 length:1965 start_codon:yes stop_codon:yes gene_type:complete